MIKREIVDQLVDSWAYLEADTKHWQSTDIGGPIEIEEPCWHIFVFHESLPSWHVGHTYKCRACGELKVVHDIDLYNYVPAGYNLSKQGPPSHLHYHDNSMRRFGRQMGFAPPESMANTLARIDGVESRPARHIVRRILRSLND